MSFHRQTPDSVQRRRSMRRLPGQVPSAYPSLVDVWFGRLASIAQIGLLAATVAGFYYTVIPLYQKAALDELIARREIELHAAQESIESAKREAYEQRRLNLTNRLRIVGADRCSGVRASMHQPDMDEPEEARHARDVDLGIDPRQCLTEMYTEYKVAEKLTATDRHYLDDRTAIVGALLEEKRQSAIKQIVNTPRVGTTKPDSLDPVGPMMQRMDRFIADAAKLGVRIAEDPSTRIQRRVALTEERIASDYRN